MKKIIFTILFLSISVSTYADERKFTYTYQSNVLGRGIKELEVWSTARIARDVPYFARLDHRIEFEWGITDQLMTAFYLNFRNVSIDDGTGMSTGFDFQGISSEWKYQFTRPARDPIGFALYGEVGLNTNELELEGKLIFDKRIAKNTFALNLVFESEWELGSHKPETELSLEGDFGWSFSISGGFSAGIEVRNHNEIVEGVWEHSALFAGPVFSYAQSSWWATLTLLPQIAALKGKTAGSNLQLGEHEKLETRLLFSFHI